MASPMSWPVTLQHIAVFAMNIAAVTFAYMIATSTGHHFLLPLLAAVFSSSWLFGRVAGVHSIVVCAILADVFLIRPRADGAIAYTNDTLALVSFLVSGLVAVFLLHALRAATQQQASILESMTDAVIITERRGIITYINPAAEAISGYTLKQAARRNFEQIFPLAAESTGESRAGIVRKVLEGDTTIQSVAHTVLVSRDGTEHSVDENGAPIRTRDGRLEGAIIVLRNTTRRRQWQDQLTQTQKMDAIARLAGGVAGDFNNLLTVITGYSEMLSSEMPPGSPLQRFADEILTASARAAELTRQLLAFGKGQSVPARLHDLNTLLANMQTMLQRVSGAGVELVILPAPGPCKITTDPGQIEQIIVNLAMNARDAMPNGGKLVLATSNVEIKAESPTRPTDLEPGPYIMLAVSDTGHGMDAETRARLFEPFFTTKNQGQASGLGLSIVYGIVKQHGGAITVFSQLGAGTIFEIYFPRAKDTAAPVPAPKVTRGSETVLIVDDEDAVRKLVHAVLATNGYNVLEARDGVEGLQLFEKHLGAIALVITDVVMPAMGGYELGHSIEQKSPATRVIFMSGYRDSHPAEGSQVGKTVLNKPFTPAALLKQVRAELDRN